MLLYRLERQSCFFVAITLSVGCHFGTGPDDTTRDREIQELALTSMTSCARLASGEVRCWGGNVDGQLGIGQSADTVFESYVPAPVHGLAKARRIDGLIPYNSNDSYYHTKVDALCATVDASVQCWGAQRKARFFWAEDTPEVLAGPVSMPKLQGFTQVVATKMAGCGLTAEATVACWGSGDDGMLGNGSTEDASQPTAVPGLTDIVEIASGYKNFCAREGSGRILCWGYGDFGELGDGGTESSSTPVEVRNVAHAVQLAMYGSGGCARMDSGQVQCWGRLGAPYEQGRVARPLPNLEKAVHIDARGNNVCAVEHTGGVTCWSTSHSILTGEVSADEGKAIAGVDQAVAVAVGSEHACVILEGREAVQCWGRNHVGQLGNISVQDSQTAVRVQGLPQPLASPPAQWPSGLELSAPKASTDGAPEGCRSTALDVSFRDQQSKLRPVTSSAAFPYGRELELKMGDFSFEPTDSDLPRADQQLVILELSNDTELDARGAERFAAPSVHTPACGPTLQARARWLTKRGTERLTEHPMSGCGGEGSVSIDVLTDEWVCGQVDVKGPNGGLHIAGSFAARMVEQ